MTGYGTGETTGAILEEGCRSIVVALGLVVDAPAAEPGTIVLLKPPEAYRSIGSRGCFRAPDIDLVCGWVTEAEGEMEVRRMAGGDSTVVAVYTTAVSVAASASDHLVGGAGAGEAGLTFL